MKEKLPVLEPLGKMFELNSPTIREVQHNVRRMRLSGPRESTRKNGAKRGSATASDGWDDLDQLTVSEVADICRFHPKTVRTWIKKNELEAIRKGRSYRVTWRALKRFLRKYRC